MDWMLVFFIVSMTPTDKVAHSITVPMATEQLCQTAKAKLTEDYQKTQAVNFMIVGECLQVR